MERLAIDGGTPVRTKPFPSNMLGAALTGEEELRELGDVVREKSPFRHYGIGSPTKVKTVEEELKKQIGTRFALAVSSGSAALQCAVAAAGLGPGDEVVIPAFAWYTDYCVLVNLGITPVFCDIGTDLNMDPDDLERKITPKTRAVIPVHYQGCPARMDRIMAIADAHGLLVIEDVAQALGGSFRGRKLGTFGALAITSFQTHKMLTCGEGGMVFTNDESLFVRAVRYHDLGSVRPFFAQQLSDASLAAPEKSFAGLQLRMSELQDAPGSLYRSAALRHPLGGGRLRLCLHHADADEGGGPALLGGGDGGGDSLRAHLLLLQPGGSVSHPYQSHVPSRHAALRSRL